MSPSVVPQRCAGVLDAVLDGEAVLYLAHSAVPLLLNTSATQVWSSIDGSASIDVIAAGLASAHGLAAVDIVGDVVAVVAELAERGAVTLVDPH